MKNNFLLSIGQKKLSNLKGRGRSVFALSTMTVLLTGIIAFASIPGANGVINGCYNRNGDSSLRVIDSTAQCRFNEIALNFSQTGPRGLQGLQGPQGMPGAPGAPGIAGTSGVSEAYTVRHPELTGQEFRLPTILLSKDVPAGSYVINAKVETANTTTLGGRNITCNLSTGDSSLVRLDEAFNASRQVVALQDTATFEVPTTITITCESSGNSTFALNSALTAIKVNAIY